MDNISELQEQLRIAKLKHSWKLMQNQLKQVEDTYKNKSFGTRSIKRNLLKSYKLDFTLEVIHVDDVYIISDKYYCEEGFRINTFEDYCKWQNSCGIIIEGKRASITKTNDTINISTGTLRHFTSSMFEGYRYEMSNEVFVNINNLISKSTNNIFSTSIKNCPEFLESYKDEIDNLKECGCEFIFLDHTETYILRNHPFLYGNYLLKNELSKSVILNMRHEAKKMAAKQTSFTCCGEYVPRCDYYDREVDKFDSILLKF